MRIGCALCFGTFGMHQNSSQLPQVSCGFVGAIKADRVTGNISLVLEVDFFKAEVEEAGLSQFVVGI